MENINFKDLKYWISGLLVFLFIVVANYIIRDKPNTKAEIEKAENRAKISVYKTQEIEALKNFYTLQKAIDRLEEIQDSVMIEKVEQLHPGDIQKELNNIFNQYFQ